MELEKKVDGSYPIAKPSPQGVPPPIPVEPEIGVLIRIESPPGVVPGILRIVRRSEITADRVKQPPEGSVTLGGDAQQPERLVVILALEILVEQTVEYRPWRRYVSEQGRAGH